MININLLSPAQKQEIKTKRLYMVIKEMIMLVLLFTAIIAILMVLSRYYLEQQLALLIERNNLQIQANQEINVEILKINKKLDGVGKIQKGFKRWSEFFIKLSAITPNNISYNFLKIYQKDGQAEVQIEGTAKTRQDLLKLKDQLVASKLFDKVDLPTSNLLAKENNNFSINATLDLKQIP